MRPENPATSPRSRGWTSEHASSWSDQCDPRGGKKPGDSLATRRRCPARGASKSGKKASLTQPRQLLTRAPGQQWKRDEGERERDRRAEDQIDRVRKKKARTEADDVRRPPDLRIRRLQIIVSRVHADEGAREYQKKHIRQSVHADTAGNAGRPSVPR